MIQDVQKELAIALAKAHDALKRELTKLRAGRANANLLDGIRVDYYGTPTPLAQMAHINVPEPRLITVKPWDKTQVKAVEKALRESDLGLNPQVDGDLIRIPLPPLTEERRKEFVKIARKYGEECKVAIRKARHDALDMLAQLETDGEVERRRRRSREEEGRRDGAEEQSSRSTRPSRTRKRTSSRCDGAQHSELVRAHRGAGARATEDERRATLTRLTPSEVGETLFSLEDASL